MGFWSIRNPWSAIEAIDEFGAGTLDGNPADGPSFDACGAAALENGTAAYELRAPTYSNIGHIRADMIESGQWTAGATIGNPRTNGCYIENVAWSIPRRGYAMLELRTDTGVAPSAADVRAVLARHGAYTIFLVTNAQALAGGEQGVHGHYVGIAAYDDAADKVYVLNSDIAGQHGLAGGQWMTLAAFMAAQPMGWAVMAPKSATPPPPSPGGNTVIILEKDAAGNVTGAHDANDPHQHIGAGLAYAAQQANLLGEDITLGEQAGSANGQPAALCTLGHRYVGGYGKASGVSRFVDFFEAAQQIEAVFAHAASLQQQLVAAQTAGQQAQQQAQAAQQAAATAQAAEATAEAQVAKLTGQVNAAAQQLASADAQIATLQQQLAAAEATAQATPAQVAIAQAAETLVSAVEADLQTQKQGPGQQPKLPDAGTPPSSAA